ncbi:mas-related G-protein coupled receptor member A-like [Echinops telfairi]|uniref:Mas-related G-protein coupled receptor member A-like n=1 Tax=Echinops telfairi TaxID=9371 RepID=A0ABM1VK71_ECHTE|nr:mas-related G-protein coupled receptor member A-like [Echinops telfairi]
MSGSYGGTGSQKGSGQKGAVTAARRQLQRRTTSAGFVSTEPASTDLGNGLSTMDESDQHPQSDIDTWTMIPGLLAIIIALCGLAGNAVVIWLLGFRLRRNPFCVYILNLAVADCLVLGTMTAYALMVLIDYFQFIYFVYNRFINFVILFPYLADMSLISAIGTERCLSILCPIWYRCRRPTHMSGVSCALIWALSLVQAFLEMLFCTVALDLCSSFNFFLWMWVIFLFVVLCGSSLVLLVKVFYGSQRKKMTRLIVTILITVLVCLLCGLPYGFGCSANPIIYFFVGSFRQQRRRLKPTLRMVLQRALQDTPEGEEPGGGPPQGPTEQAESSVV